MTFLADRVFQPGRAPDVESVATHLLRPFCAAAFDRDSARATPANLPALDLSREWWFVNPASFARAALRYGASATLAQALVAPYLELFAASARKYWQAVLETGGAAFGYPRFHKLLHQLTAPAGLLWVQTNMRVSRRRLPVFYVGWPAADAEARVCEARTAVGVSATSTSVFRLRAVGAPARAMSVLTRERHYHRWLRASAAAAATAALEDEDP